MPLANATTSRSPRGAAGARPWAAPLLAVASVVLTLALAELGARAWVAWRWPAERTRFYTEDLQYRDGYEFDPVTGFRPAPSVTVRNVWGHRFTHNSLGYRGPEIAPAPPPGTHRIVLMGASTVYGFFVQDDETSAVQLARILERRRPDASFEVVNAGVPGWTTRETLINLERSVLSLEPEAIVVMDGRNEVFPEVYDGFREDYSHYRRLGWDFRKVHAGYRRLFRVSHLAMWLMTRRGGRMGFSLLEEHPIFGYIRYENRPNLEELARNAADPTRSRVFRRNLERFVEIARAHGIRPLLATIPFLPEKWEATGVLEKDPRVVPIVTDLVARNNEIAREVAAATGAALVDAAEIRRPQLFVDDCHLTPEGEQRLARRLARALRPVLDY